MSLPASLAGLAGGYFLATVAHFGHNAEFIAFYPGMPASVTRETVYLAWLGVTGVGALSLLALRLGFATIAVALLGLYGACGLDALLHYTLALCSEHTLVANVTIWTEASLGTILLLACAVLLGRKLHPAVRPH